MRTKNIKLVPMVPQTMSIGGNTFYEVSLISPKYPRGLGTPLHPPLEGDDVVVSLMTSEVELNMTLVVSL